MNVSRLASADGVLQIIGQSLAIGLPQSMSNPITHQGVEADMKQDGREGDPNARTPNGRSNDVVMNKIFVFWGKHFQKQISQFGRLHEFAFNFMGNHRYYGFH
jgi:hypothetical protein